jgi:hypothetical protein
MKNRSWITTIIGLIIAIGNVALPLYQTGTVDNKTILISCGFAVIGFFTKDYNKTGKPTKKNTTNL